MSKSARRPQQLYAIIMWLLSILFASFLIGFGGLIIRDLPVVEAPLSQNNFLDQAAFSQAEAQETAANDVITELNKELAAAQQSLEAARQDYASEKTNFDNWIATRSATNSQATSPEVIRRTNSLEGLKAVEREAIRKVSDIEQSLSAQYTQLNEARAEKSTLRANAQIPYQRALHQRELRIFGFRLLLTLPLLLVAGWMTAKKRKSAYWPLYRGFVIFALFAFFVELVPYLPSYGGYVRFLVGILSIIVVGYFLIKWMRGYLARKQAEEARSESERRQDIDYETALKKIGSDLCPGCDRNIIKHEDVPTDYCVHCGIHLQSECPNCQTRNVTFHKFCLKCGTPKSQASDAV